MLIRISLIIAILAGLAVGTVNFLKVKEKITTLQTELKDQTDQKEKAQRELAKTSKDLDTTKKSLDQTKQALTAANSEKDKALNAADTANKRADQLTEDLSKAKTTLADVQAELESYHGTGLKPIEILALNTKLKASQTQVAEAQAVVKGLERKNDKLTAELERYTLGGERIVYLPANLVGKIVVVDPKYSFVILNVGDEQGIKEAGELLVSRNGKFVAKVRVTSVQKDRCIANVMEGPSKLGEPIEGDLVIPAHPAS
jgi:multidrug efflux pump subunit AcrA (membrane-fusion protein)